MKRLAKLVLMMIAILFVAMGSAMAADLIVTSITWNPATDLQEGQDVTLIAEIQNSDTDTVTTNFAVSFSVDGTNLGEATVFTTEVPLGLGAMTTVEFVAQLSAGENLLTVVADSGNVVTETDETNNSLSADLPDISADNNPPEGITDLTVSDSQATLLTFSWTHSANTAGDIAGYKVYFDGASEPELLPATQSSIQKTGLSSASAYDIRITAYDGAGNESAGVSTTGYTVLDNPIGLIVSSRPAFVYLSWEAASPEAYMD